MVRPLSDALQNMCKDLDDEFFDFEDWEYPRFTYQAKLANAREHLSRNQELKIASCFELMNELGVIIEGTCLKAVQDAKDSVSEETPS